MIHRRSSTRHLSIACWLLVIFGPASLRAAENGSAAVVPRSATTADASPSGSRKVEFVPKQSGRSYVVTVDDSLTCTTPCELQLRAGSHRVAVKGDADFADAIVVTESTKAVSIANGNRIGLLPLIAGGVVGTFGFMFAFLPAEEPCDPYETSCKPGEVTNQGIRATGRTMLIGGAVGVVAGAVLLGALRNGLGVESGLPPGTPAAPGRLLSALSVGPTSDGGMAVSAGFAF